MTTREAQNIVHEMDKVLTEILSSESDLEDLEFNLDDPANSEQMKSEYKNLIAMEEANIIGLKLKFDKLKDQIKLV